MAEMNSISDLPPILPEIKNLLQEYLLCPERLPIHDYERNQEFWPKETNISNLFYTERAPYGTTLKVQRDMNTGKIIEFYEVSVVEAGSNSKNSMSLNRAPAQSSNIVRGDSTSLPFWPGGIPDPVIVVPDKKSVNFTERLVTPPGFTRGVQIEFDGCQVVKDEDNFQRKLSISNDVTDSIVNLMDLVQKEQDFLGLWNEKYDKATESENVKEESTKLQLPSDLNEMEILPKEKKIPILNISNNNSEGKFTKNTKWAVMIDIEKPVTNFSERIPEMAFEYPFELDPFQKQAILKLEENCDVFVAAHTSAGKTVVAEYAIALSQKHRTRTIYTSPIKALSNQKYRDFKKTFHDVGLITGDFQINQSAMCLIMTTEILRSMLYYGSEVTRDLEFVIFDEVHYINNAERGHVWEEVLILLPDYVRIVLLSATVPNTMEFANWLGRIKERTIYVISTMKRPVPLQHYLYTGVRGRMKDKPFLIIDADGQFLTQGYEEVSTTMANRKDVFSNPIKSEATAMTALINYLKSTDLLPVIAFTFSRLHCDQITEHLKHLDLTTGEEKHKIHVIFQECVKCLKDADQQLPQIKKMREILRNGIGVHHSGILPFVKEIVEILFQNRLVKVLFATETFAMGVNMPARTVVFNSLRKFDGNEKRFLNPAEYIQMAGRAGRRNLDKTGTVIIRVQREVPEVTVLKKIIQGKPEKLESQFRLTYSMLLSLLRTENLNVEHMMSHSFQEMHHASKSDQLKVVLKQTELEYEEEMKNEFGEHLQQLSQYYDVAYEYIQLWDEIQPKIMTSAGAQKELIPGRVLIVSHKNHFNKLGILLNIRKDNGLIRVLVLTNEQKDEMNEEKYPDIWYRMLSYSHTNIFQPDGPVGHEVIDINYVDVLEISKKLIKINVDFIVSDWDKRRIPRFRNDPPGQSCQQAIQELAKLANSILLYGENIVCFNRNDFKIKLDLSQSIEQQIKLQKQKDQLERLINCTKIANFEEQFRRVFRRKYLKTKLDQLRMQTSHRSLELYPEYESRIEVLKKFGYINQEKRVEQKGQMACGIGMNELLITEMVFRNKLSHLEPAEIVALLSATVSNVKSIKTNQQPPTLTEPLQKAMKEMEDIHRELRNIEDKHSITNLFEDLNFNLVEVVYEWACEKPFAEIMKLTDVQEGIIVRCIQQLNEILNDIKGADRFIGDPHLKNKMEEASNAIKRDIVFAASLYIQNENYIK